MTTLHLGVIDIPYAYAQEGDRKKGKKKRKIVKSITTGEVADILEENYGVMETFFDVHEVEIVDHLTEALAGALESMVMGAPPKADPFAAGTQQINEMFKTFILSGEAEAVSIPGTPTKAALKGVSHRRVHPYAKANPRRPSFYDTGLYVDSFMSWVD